MIKIKHDKDGFLIGKGGKPVLENILDNTETLLKIATKKPLKTSVFGNRAELVKSKPMQVENGKLHLYSHNKQQVVKIDVSENIHTSDGKPFPNPTQAAQPQFEALEGKQPKVQSIQANKQPDTPNNTQPKRDANGRFVRKDKANAERSRNAKISKASLEESKKQTRLLYRIFRKKDNGGGILSKLGFLGSLIRGLLKAPIALAGGLLTAPLKMAGGLFGGLSHGAGFLGKLGRGFAKGGILSALIAGFQGISVENDETLTRGQKNKQHVKNITGAAGGVGGAAAGAAIGTAIFPGIGTILGGVVGGFLGSEITTQFVGKLDEWLPPEVSDNMFKSWDDFTSTCKEIWEVVGDNAKTAWHGAMDTLNNGISFVWNELLPKEVAVYFKMASNITKNAWAGFSSFVEPYWDAVSNQSSSAWNEFKSFIKPYWDSAKEVMSNTWQTLASTAQSQWEAVKKSSFGQWVGEKYDSVKSYLVSEKDKAEKQVTQERAQYEKTHGGVNGWLHSRANNDSESILKNIPNRKGKFNNGTLYLGQQDIVDIMKVAATEVVGSLKGDDFKQQLHGVIDTILNRASLKGGDIRKVVNERWAFSDINSTQKTAYGSVQNVPMSRVSNRLRDETLAYLQQRANGLESSVGGNVNYANPYALKNAKPATRRWVAEVYEQARKTGHIFGKGKAIHVHGTPTGNKKAGKFHVHIGDMPKDFIDLSTAQQVSDTQQRGAVGRRARLKAQKVTALAPPVLATPPAQIVQAKPISAITVPAQAPLPKPTPVPVVAAAAPKIQSTNTPIISQQPKPTAYPSGTVAYRPITRHVGNNEIAWIASGGLMSEQTV